MPNFKLKIILFLWREGNMKYKILAISDIHWGAVEAKRLYDNLQLVLNTIRIMVEVDRLDLVVICGDYFDYKLSLNSKSSLLAITWMDELYKLCIQHSIKIRIVKGTHEHDNNQLEAFRSYESEMYKIFNTNTLEETLPGLTCLYCPDENIPTKEYKQTYIQNLVGGADIGFFHGSFDIVLPDIVVQHSEETNARNVIFPFAEFSSLIKGPMISGHWHNGSFNNPLIYTGSFDRWAFGEEDPKGFLLVQYDTETYEYSYQLVENTNARKFDTLYIDTMNFPSAKEYSELIQLINENYDLGENRLRVVISRSTERPEDEELINAFKKYYVNNRNLKIDIKNIKQITKKKEVKKSLQELTTKYGFLFDNKEDNSAENIQQFILVNKNRSIPIDIIEKYITPFLSK